MGWRWGYFRKLGGEVEFRSANDFSTSTLEKKETVVQKGKRKVQKAWPRVSQWLVVFFFTLRST